MDRREAAKWALRRTRRERLIYIYTVLVSIVITAAVMLAMTAPWR
jgi:predicted nucleotidyltransferase